MRSPSQRHRLSIDEATPPERRLVRDQLRRRLDRARVAVCDVEGDQPAEARVADALHARVALEPPGEVACRLGLAAHPHLQRLQPVQQGGRRVGRGREAEPQAGRRRRRGQRDHDEDQQRDPGEHTGARPEHEVHAHHSGDRARTAPMTGRDEGVGIRRARTRPTPRGRRPDRRSSPKPTGPRRSSTLLPKIHRNRMFPPRCSNEPCRNIEASAESQTFFCGKGFVPSAPLPEGGAANSSPARRTTGERPGGARQGWPRARM